ncbi:hypothetical protein [Streptomyces sp. NPDC059894]|uniref:hypothetical protein n=1 Tax=unclassified Streptomyces TaxID=2593676 RepID=UPI0036562D06
MPYVEVSCMEGRRERRRRPLLDCVSVRFEEAVPVRPFRWPPGGRHFPGWYWAATTGQHVGFESWLERDHLVLMGELAWDHARQQAPRNGNEAQIADAAAALFKRAHDGPPDEKDPPAKRSRRDRRIAARTRATAPGREIPDPPAASKPMDEDTDTSLAEVVPLGLFDPLADPWRRP